MDAYKRANGVDISDPYVGVAIIGGTVLLVIILGLVVAIALMLVHKRRARKEMESFMTQLAVGPSLTYDRPASISIYSTRTGEEPSMSTAHQFMEESSRSKLSLSIKHPKHPASEIPGSNSDTSSYYLPADILPPACPSSVVLTDTTLYHHPNDSFVSHTDDPAPSLMSYTTNSHLHEGAFIMSRNDSHHIPGVDANGNLEPDLTLNFPHPSVDHCAGTLRPNTGTTSIFSATPTIGRPMTITGIQSVLGSGETCTPDPRPKYAVDTGLHRTMTMERLRSRVQEGSTQLDKGWEAFRQSATLMRVPSGGARMMQRVSVRRRGSDTKIGSYPMEKDMGSAQGGDEAEGGVEGEKVENDLELAALWAPAERFNQEEERGGKD
ncbi:hypothetical protein BDV98DRAFT_574832 [Pterulicium gracile]|uniref:Uncharacterized protein n=1 Tax=Pterulicium gracile TaxID=1884261 RepID=A0A5C3Q601_9AGAR|nr:hypothetical protein BDV98DRAFT_574832 [Pterula gracilis]